MALTDYKAKYMDLKAKFLNTTDLAWRLGYEQGLKDSQLEQLQQTQMMTQQASQPSNAAPTEEHEESTPSPVSENPNGDELGQHIEKLESMLGKGEIAPIELQSLKKTLNDIRSLQVQSNLAKSMESIRNTKMPLTFSPKNQANLNDTAKKSLSLQEKIVSDIFTKWEKDESKAFNDISSIINAEGIIKKD